MANDERSMFTLTALKERGWSQRAIDTLLPPPELKQSWVYRSVTMKLWPEDVVLAAEETDEFKEFAAKKQARTEAAKKATETKRKTTREYIDRKISEIEVIRVSEQRLLAAVEAYQEERAYRYGEVLFMNEVPEPVLTRWCVNEIRHCFTNYDMDLYEGRGKVGINEEYYRYKNAVLEKIAEVYPQYEEECRRQMTLTEERKGEKYE